MDLLDSEDNRKELKPPRTSSRDMKIAILGTRGIPARYGGFETFAEQLAVRLVERGHDVTVYCEANIGPQPGEYRGIRLQYIGCPNVSSLSTILFDLRCLWDARKHYDCVYMLGYGSALFCFLPRLWGTEVWINMDGIEWARAKWGLIARTYFRAMEAIAMWTADGIVADADSIRHHLVSRHSRLPDCSVIAYGSNVPRSAPDVDQISRWCLRPNEYYLVVARLEPENHIREIISGYCKSESQRPLIVIGDHLTKTPYVREITSAADKRVLFLGGVYDQPALQSLRFYSRAYFHGHSVGGTNPSLLEAMACRNLVVAHDNPFNREVLGDCGLFFATPTELSEVLRMLDHDHCSYERMRDGALARVKTFYSWDLITDQYCQQIFKASDSLDIGLPKTAGVKAYSKSHNTFDCD